MHLKRSIGVIGLTFVAVSGILGSGWLFAPLLTVQQAGPAAIISWGVGAAAMLVLALCFAEVTGVLPVAGGIARIPHLTHGDVVSSVLGWSAWVGYNTAAPIETIVMLEYLDVHLPWMFHGDPTKHVLTPLGMLMASGILAIFVVINAFGASIFARANAGITWLKLLIPIIVGVAVVATKFDASNFTAGGGFAPMGAKGVFAGVSTGGIIFALIGFRHAIDMAGEVKRPQVVLPVALVLGLLVCAGIYVLLQVAFIGAIDPALVEDGWDKLAFPDRLGPMAAVAGALGIGWVSATLYTGAVAAPFGGGLVAMGSMARLGYALSRNGFFPKWMAYLSRRGVPLRALLVNWFFGMVVVVFIPFRESVAINAAAITLSFCGGPLALYALRKQMPDAPRPLRLPAAPVFAGAGFLVATLIVYWSGWETTWRLGVIMAVGLALFAIKMLANRKHLRHLDLREALWLAPYAAGIGLISYFGDFPGGRGLLAFPWDVTAALALSVGVLVLAIWCRLPNETAAAYRERYMTPGADTTPL